MLQKNSSINLHFVYLFIDVNNTKTKGYIAIGCNATISGQMIHFISRLDFKSIVNEYNVDYRILQLVLH
jgi:hypothetical protein